MFPSRYYAARMFAPRYFPEVGATPPAVVSGGTVQLTFAQASAAITLAPASVTIALEAI
jgi:hypothetical protein